MYEVGLGDSPMSIARKLTGNPRQHVALLAANPHKPIVHVRGIPTFASLGVGERLNVPPGFVGGDFDHLAPVERTEVVFTDPQITQQRKETEERPELRARAKAHEEKFGWGPAGQFYEKEYLRKKKKAEAHEAGSPFDVFVDVITAPVKAAGAVIETTVDAVDTIGEAVGGVPILGDVTRIVSDVYTAPLRLTQDIASGARIDQAVLKAAKDQVRIVREAAPYAQIVISVVPGIGTGVSAAMSAGIALAEGRGIDEIAKAAIRGALPGGPLAVAGFDAALKVAQGQNVGKVALESARELIPAGPGRQAFDIGLAVATGENIQNALTQGFMDLSVQQMGVISSDWLKSVASTPDIVKSLAAIPKDVTSGYALAMGALSHEGISPQALRAMRQKLTGKALEGFDLAVRSAEKRMPGITNALPPLSVPSPKAKADLEKLAKLSPKEQEELRQLVALKKLSPKEQENLRQLAAIKKLSPKEQEQLRQFAALKKLSPEDQKALAAMSPEERAQLRELELAKLSPKEQEDLRNLAAAPPTPAPPAPTPPPAAPSAFQYGPYPRAV